MLLLVDAVTLRCAECTGFIPALVECLDVKAQQAAGYLNIEHAVATGDHLGQEAGIWSREVGPAGEKRTDVAPRLPIYVPDVLALRLVCWEPITDGHGCLASSVESDGQAFS